MRGVERTIAQAVIPALKRDDAKFTGGEHRGLQRRFDCLEAGVAEDRFAGRTSYTSPHLCSAPGN